MTPRQARLGVDIFTGLVAASIGVALAGLTWRLTGDPGQRLGASPVAARPQRPVDLGPLIALAPFGTAAPAAPTQATNQPLTLRGILLASPRAASSALIAVGDQPAQAFYVGQAVGNGTIDAIEVDHVVLLSGGARSILAFPDKSGGGATAGAPPPAPLPAMASTDVPAPAASPPPLAPAAPAAPPASGPALLGSLGASPTGSGYAIGANLPPALRNAGLQPGDQVVAVNGTPIADALGNGGLLASAASAGTARIDLVRAGQRLSLSVPFK